MALTGKKAPRDGWRHQAERLADTHTAVATAVMAATEQARRRPLLKPVSCDFPTRGAEYKRGLETSKTEPANEIEPTRVELAELEQQVARETAATWILNARRDTLAARAARAAAAEKRIAELEGDLGSARERLVLLENENHSLQSSLELTVSENSRLSCRLTESDAAGDRARSQLEQVKRPLTSVEAERNRLAAAGHEARSQLEQTTAALVTTEAERITLSFAVDEVNKKRQTETNTLNTRLGAMSERAVTAEKLLAKAQRRLLVRTAENCSVERKFADATVARDAAHKKLELLQNSLQVKERQVQELERSRSELIEVTTTLLKAFKTRNIALARAEQRIKLLSELLTQLEADNAC